MKVTEWNGAVLYLVSALWNQEPIWAPGGTRETILVLFSDLFLQGGGGG